MMNAIENAVAPLKTDAMNRAEKETRAAVEQARQELAAGNNDLHVVAPYPSSSNISRNEYIAKVGRYRFFASITTWRSSSVHLHEPCYADIDAEKVEHVVEQARKDAAAQYDAFVAKLVAKIGATKSARLEGNHVWSYSHLFVTTASGAQQIWKTQIIVNHSKLGLPFYQWPTRQVKAAK